VTDNLTGLVWTKNITCDYIDTTWFDALEYCNNLAHGECELTDSSVAGDWRLANIKELLSLIDRGNSSPALPSGHPFIEHGSTSHWSSTTASSNTTLAWRVNMNSGSVTTAGGDKTEGWDAYVWCVRGGQ
jgi:hypothetical protein